MEDVVPNTQMDPEEYDRSLARKRMASGVLFFDPAGRVLLVDPVYKPTWEIPGGSVEANESPATPLSARSKKSSGSASPWAGYSPSTGSLRARSAVMAL